MSGSATADVEPIARSEGRQTLRSIQVLRGFAAIAVAIYHTHLILAKPEYGAIDLFGAVAGKGWLGVNFFFVLSGFIIIYAHARDLGVPGRLPVYLWRRFSRVYPIYWVVLSVYIAAAFLGIGYPDFRATLPDMASSYLLVPFVSSPSLPLQVAWTLFYEVGFYALFTVAILDRRAGVVAGVAWIAAILVYGLVLGRSAFGPLNMWNIYFPFGIGAYLLFQRLDRRLGTPLLVIGCVLLVAMAVAGVVENRIAMVQARPIRLLALALPFTLILLGSALMERERAWAAPRVLMLLGNASYAIYLVHSPVISVLAQINRKLAPGLLPGEALFPVVAGASVVAGVIAHLLLEKPLIALFRHPPGRRPASRIGSPHGATD